MAERAKAAIAKQMTRVTSWSQCLHDVPQSPPLPPNRPRIMPEYSRRETMPGMRDIDPTGPKRLLPPPPPPQLLPLPQQSSSPIGWIQPTIAIQASLRMTRLNRQSVDKVPAEVSDQSIPIILTAPSSATRQRIKRTLRELRFLTSSLLYYNNDLSSGFRCFRCFARHRYDAT